MQRTALILSGFYGFTTVLMAALASHLLAGRLDAASLTILHTGIDVEAWHALALLALALGGAPLRKAAWRAITLFGFGTLLFCGAVYYRAISGHSLGGVAPTGGISLMLGWLALFAAGFKRA
jgi:uncharacterized membrane protein YgdD (TMEM256/DUF423 family)